MAQDDPAQDPIEAEDAEQAEAAAAAQAEAGDAEQAEAEDAEPAEAEDAAQAEAEDAEQAEAADAEQAAGADPEQAEAADAEQAGAEDAAQAAGANPERAEAADAEQAGAADTEQPADTAEHGEAARVDPETGEPLTGPDGEPYEAVLSSLTAALTAGRDPVAELEALLFATHVPLTLEEIGETLGLTQEAVQQTLIDLERALEQRGGPLGVFPRRKEQRGRQAVQPAPLGYILDVKAVYRRNVVPVGRPVLSQGLTETLALIALNQPIAQSRLVREKGSSVYDHVKELVAKGWVQKQKEGRSYTLCTTDAFAAEFGLENDPELIKRALARAAGVTGEAELVGSERVRFDESGIDLVAEARECLISGGEAPATAGEERPFNRLTEYAGAEGAASGGAEAGSSLPASFAADEPTEADDEDCLVSGGEAPAPSAFDRPQTEEEPVAETDPTPSEASAETETGQAEGENRLAHLLELIDDDATADDW